jgi:hypothetical protein
MRIFATKNALAADEQSHGASSVASIGFEQDRCLQSFAS